MRDRKSIAVLTVLALVTSADVPQSMSRRVVSLLSDYFLGLQS